MLKKVLIGIAVILVVLAAVVAMQPGQFSIQRSATIQAPAEVVFPYVNNFKNWSAWSPWEAMDPNMQRSYEGPDAGVGAKYAWKGNDKVGQGSMEIVESRPNERIDIKLVFMDPFEATNPTSFEFAPENNGTKVTWTMNGENNFVGKAFSLVMDMDKMVGADFEKGLASMKSAAEADAAKLAAPQAGTAPTDATAPAPVTQP